MIRWFNNLSMAKKVTLLNTVIALFVVMSLLFCNAWTRSLADSFRNFIDRDQLLAFTISEIYAQGLQSEQATRNLLLDPTDDKAAENYRKAVQEVQKLYPTALQTAPAESTLRTELLRARDIWEKSAILKEQVQTLSRQGKHPEALRILKEEETPRWREFKTILLALDKRVKADMQKQKQLIDQHTRNVLLKSTGIALLAVLAILFTGIAMVKVITAPLHSLGQVLAAITAGDLTARSSIDSKDEMGTLARGVNEMTETLQQVLVDVAQHVDQVAASSNSLFQTSEKIAAGTEELAGQTSSLATASEEMSATSTEIAANCLASADEAAKASSAAENGTAIVRQTIHVMNRIADRVRGTATTVAALGTRSSEIGAIIGTIEDIADQTNLLALNAAIEAARAGEQGRGFAVVADEVRALAERTTTATREIGTMIKAIQDETMGAVASMEEGVTEVELGTTEAGKSGEALGAILTQISALSMQINQIATAAEEQMATFNEISGNILQIREVVDVSTRGAHDAEAAASTMSQMSEELRHLVDRFRIAG